MVKKGFALAISENYFSTGRHKTFYLASGPEDGPLLVMTHGWPELSLSWRHQLKYFGAKGYRVIAPDMRGYGRSSRYERHADYSQEEIVLDMCELFESLGKQSAVWIGHDWGSPVAWNMALHHPEYVRAVASLCVPYGFGGHPEKLGHAINRELYPVEQYPHGQWDYQLFYYEDFELAQQQMEIDPYRMVKLLFRKGDPSGIGTIAGTALTRKNKGWFGGSAVVPDVDVDVDVVSEEDAQTFAKYLTKNSFFGPNSWYVNGEANEAFDAKEPDKELEMPVLFIHATYDFVCDTTTTKFAEPMRKQCSHLTEKRIDSGHWMAQEKPEEVNSFIEEWLESLE